MADNIRTFRRAILLALIFAWQVTIPAQALPETIMIKLFDAYPPQESVEVRGPLKVIEPSPGRSWEGSLKVRASRGAVYLSARGEGGKDQQIGSAPTVVIVPASNRGVEITRADGVHRRYLGQLLFTAAPNTKGLSEKRNKVVLSIVEKAKSKDYVSAVLGSESPTRFPEEARKALAVMVLNRLETRARFQPLSDSTKEQLYFGCAAVTPSVERAVNDVYSWRLYAGKTMIESYFSSTCAGGTSSGTAIFGKPARHMQYLKSVKCDFCSASPFWKARTTRVKKDRLIKILGGLPEITHKDGMDRPIEVTIHPASGNIKTMSGYNCWLEMGRALGWSSMPSTRYAFSRKSDSLQITSSGAGHGVGLCVWGAMDLAERGKTFKEILLFYFPTCHLQKA